MHPVRFTACQNVKPFHYRISRDACNLTTKLRQPLRCFNCLRVTSPELPCIYILLLYHLSPELLSPISQNILDPNFNKLLNRPSYTNRTKMPTKDTLSFPRILEFSIALGTVMKATSQYQANSDLPHHLPSKNRRRYW